MIKWLLLVLPIGIALGACITHTVIQFPSNMTAMSFVDAAYYEKPVVYATQNTDHPVAHVTESTTARAVTDGLPGVVMLVNKQENGTWVSAKGSIDLKSNISMRLSSLSRVGSITKMFTAVVVHHLVQEGKLALDDSTSNYLPAGVTHGIANADRTTIRQLLGHTSGICQLHRPFRYIRTLQKRN